MKYKMPSENEPAGNAYSILAMVTSAMRENCLEDEIDDYIIDATSSDYKHLREVSQRMLDRINK